MGKFENMVYYLLNNSNFVVLDVETTTFSPLKGGRIIEIGLVKIENDEIKEEYDFLVNPEQKIPKKITELTGITNEMVEDKPTIGQILPFIYNNIIQNNIVVCHNAEFDWNRFLKFYLEKVGIYNTQNNIIDVLVLAKNVFTNKKKVILKNVAEELGLSLENAHRAVDDAKVTAQILLKLKEIFKEKGMQEHIQIEPKTNYFKEKQKILKEEIKIYSIKYWEKPITKKKKYQRIYVTSNIGSVYFDIPSKTWYVKEIRENYLDKNLDLKDIESLVLNKLNYKTIDELVNYRN